MDLCPSAEHGFVFQCQRCGKCCSNQTEGLVFVYQQDIDRLKQFLNLSMLELAEKYLAIVYYKFTIWTENLEDSGERIVLPTLVLNAERTIDCIFLDQVNVNKLCVVYPGRPFQCESYPYWSMFMTSQQDFEKNRDACLGFDHSSDPSIRTDPKEIINWVRKERQLERDYVQQMQRCDNVINYVYPFLREAKGVRKLPN